MRVTNLILHIITVIIMLPDLVFVGLNTLVGLGYLDGVELIIVPTAAMIFFAAFLASTAGAIITMVAYKKSPRVYITRELLIHIVSAVCFVMAIIYLILIRLHSSVHGSGFSEVINIAGLIVSVAGIIVTLIGRRKIKKAAK